MGFGSFFRGIGAQLNPFDGGKTYGSYNPPQKKKQEQTNAPTVIKPTPKPNIRTNASNTLDVISGAAKKPTDFGTLQVSNRVKIPNNEVIASSKPDTPQKPQVKDTRAWGTKLFDTLNPNDDGRSWAVPGKQSKPNFVQRNLSPTGVFNIGKETVQGSARLPVEMAMTAVAPVKRIQAADKLRSEGAKSGDPRFKEAMDNAGSHSWQPSGWQKRVFGSDKVQNFAETGKDIKGAIKDATGKDVNSAIPTAAIIALNMIPGGRKASKAALKSFENASMASKSLARDIPIQEVVDRGIKIPTRVVEGAPIQDVTPRLPGETPALAPTPKPTVRTPEPSPLIQDVAGGETFATPDSLVKRNVEDAMKAKADRFNSTDTGNMNDVTPRKAPEPFKVAGDEIKTAQDKIIDDYAAMLKNMGEGNGVAINQATGTRISNNFRFPGTGSKRLTKAQWRDMAEEQLRGGSAEPSLQKAFDDAPNQIGDKQSLLAQGEQVDVPVGTPIKVKQVKGIDVQQVTDVPANLPETPGTVRVSSQTDPLGAQTQAVANAPVAAAPAPLPKVGSVGLDGKVVTKAMVRAARKQLSKQKQLNKVNQQRQELFDNAPDLTPKPQSGNPGFVPTNEFRKGENGNVIEVAHNAAEEAQAAIDTANLSAADVMTQAQREIDQFGTVSAESARNLKGMISSGRYPQNSPEYIAMSKAQVAGGSKAGQSLSLFNRETRRTSSGKQLANRFISKLYGVTEDPLRLTDSDIVRVNTAEDAFANARDAANRAGDRYNATKSADDFAVWKQAKQAAQAAEENSLIEQFNIAQRVLKDNTDPAALKALQAAEKEAGVYQMDWIDANMLSGTGTGTRNYLNTTGIRLENRMFGFGGYSSKGAKLGNKIGNRQVVSDFKARNQLDGNRFVKGVKQWSTTMNTLGEGNIQAVAHGRAYKFYEKQLKAQGLTGDRLARDVEYMLDADPQAMVAHYEGWAMKENALSALAHSKKIEQTLANAIAGQGGGKAAQMAAKAAVRLTVGFPTVIGRSLVGGAKRATLGVPEAIHAAFVGGDKLKQADLLYSAKVHGGSGAMLYAAGWGLAQSGIITGPYPENDPAERERWEAEGIQPNSIKIAGQYFSIPGYFGALAMPLMVPAYIKDATSAEDIAKGIGSAVMNLSPTESAAKFFAGIDGRGGDQWVKNTATSLVRAYTPVGALLNQIARMTDSTKNDTTTKDAISNFLDNVASGIPVLNNKVNTIAKTDMYGNELHNPNPVATFFGAQGSVQGQGSEDVQQSQNVANETYAQLDQYGVLQNDNLMSLVDEKVRAQITRGQDLTPEQVTAIQKKVTKGISAGITADSDSNWRENGDYATDRTARQVKLQMLEADPTAKKSDIAGLKVQIARDDVLEKNNVPYERLKSYQTTTEAEWREMGDGDGKDDDHEMYQSLWEMDQMLTEVGGS